MKIEVKAIGTVLNNIKAETSPGVIKEQVSIIELDPVYMQGLKDIKTCEYLDIVFYFHLNQEIHLIINSPLVQDKGVFGTRAPSRPNHIGITTVKLLSVDENRLRVTGLDAIDGTPVLDIKCCDTSIFDKESVHKSIQGENPRIDIDRSILSVNRDDLLYKAGQLHGHICPGIAMGVLCGAEIMKMIYIRKEDPYDYFMTAEQPNCVLDGIMFVTGFTPGKRKLILESGERMRYKIVTKEGKGWLIESSDHNREYINRLLPDEMPKLERALRVLNMDFKKIFDVTELSGTDK